MVNKRLKEFKQLVKAGKIDLNLWMIHFGKKRPDKCKCNDCLDFKAGFCKGGIDPYICMQNCIIIK